MHCCEILDNRLRAIIKDCSELQLYYSNNVNTMSCSERAMLENLLKVMEDEKKLLLNYLDSFKCDNSNSDNNISKQVVNNRRTFFRIELRVPLCSSLTVIQVGRKNVSLGKTQVCIDNIGPGGLAFLSNLDFPVSKDIIINFGIKLLNETYDLQGIIVRKVNVVDNIFRYGVKFDLDEVISPRYVQLFNTVSVKLRERPVLPKCSFCEGKGEKCIKLLGAVNKNYVGF